MPSANSESGIHTDAPLERGEGGDTNGTAYSPAHLEA